MELTGGCHPANGQQVAEGAQASDDAQDFPQLVHVEDEREAAEADIEEDAEPPAKRPAISAVTRGSMLDAALFPEQDLRLNIGICGATHDGEEVLEVSSPCLGIILCHPSPCSRGLEESVWRRLFLGEVMSCVCPHSASSRAT